MEDNLSWCRVGIYRVRLKKNYFLNYLFFCVFCFEIFSRFFRFSDIQKNKKFKKEFFSLTLYYSSSLFPRWSLPRLHMGTNQRMEGCGRLLVIQKSMHILGEITAYLHLNTRLRSRTRCVSHFFSIKTSVWCAKYRVGQKILFKLFYFLPI